MRHFLIVTIFFCTHQFALAHDVAAQWKLEDGKVVVDVFFDSDFPGSGAVVKVRDAKKKVLLEGKTNDKGRWTFAAPKPGEYELYVDAGEGHRVTEKMVIPSTGAEETSGGTNRDEFTQFPLSKIIIGIVTIAVLALAAMIALRVNRHQSPAPGGESNSTNA